MAGKQKVLDAIDALTAVGGTHTLEGLNMAKGILTEAKKNNSGRKQVIILFTDGDTDSDQESVYELAKELKDNGVLIYTVGLFADADQTQGGKIGGYGRDKEKDNNNLFLNKVSNNDTLYTSSKPATATDKTYYLPATNANSLNTVFEQISKEVSMLDLTIDSNAVLQDTLSGYFTFDVDSGNIADKIEVWTAKAENVADDGQVTWKSAVKSDTLKAEVSEKTVSVKGFNYGEKAVTVSHPNGVKTVSGEKLIIKIPIKPDASNENVTWTAGKNNYDTNDTSKGKEAGLTGYKDKKDHELSTLLPSSPKAPVTGYTVTYQYAGTAPQGAPALPMQATYIKGQTYNVAATSALSGYQFTGWCKDDANCTSDPTSGPQTMGTANVTYYGKWTNATVNDVDLAPYVKKTLTGDLPTGYAEIFTAKITGTSITETEGLTITTDEFNAADTKTFKGNDATKVDLTIGTEYVYTVTEVVPSPATTGMTYGATVEFALKATDANTIEFYTVSADGTKTKVDAAADQYVTITNAYNPTSVGLSLSECFQKHLTSNTANVPTTGKTFTLTITGTSDNITDKTAIIGTAAVGTLAANTTGTSYGGSAYFTSFKKGTADVSALNFTAAGTYIYKVQETAGSVAGMSYDTTEYTLTVVVTDNAGALEITSAIVTKPGTTDTPVEVTDLKTSFLTIENTFKAAELPLDPTTDPTTGEVTPKIVKKLRVTSGSAAPTADLPFTVAVYEGNAVDEAKRVATGTATIPANSPDETTVNFTGLATLVFPEAGRFTYTIHEDTGSTSGVRYDGYLYTMTVEVTKNTSDNSLSATCSFSYPLGEETVVANSITITNTYTEPKEPSVVSKKVVTTDAQFPAGLGTAIDEFKSIHKIKEVLYPTGDGTTNNTLEVPYGTDSVTLLYAITVNRGTESDKMDFDDNGATFVFAVGADVATGSHDHFDVTFNDGISTAVIYVAKTHTLLNFVGGKCTVENVISEEIKATTTVTEKDPNKLTINFADYVKKELTATGTKTASDVDFTVDVKGKEWITIITSAEGEEAISTYADEFDPKYSRTLTAHFDSITGGETKTAPFNGSTVEIDHAGQYFFVLTEEKGTRTGVTYDESVYTVYISVEKKEDKLVVAHVTIYKDYKLFDGNTITFHNTIDTGKDDYYPIIIPTIINKDTGMLNKTDHFAYVIGYPDGTVHPNGQITRAEVATIFFRLLRDEVRDGAFTTSNSYSDVAYGKWYNNPISTMSALGIITGYPDGTFKPNKPITRAEFAAIAARFDETQSGKSATFSDVIGHWAAKEIGIAYYNDWIKGYPDGTFKPDQNITRAEAMTLINRVLERKPESPADLLTNMNKWTDNLDTSKWYYLDVQEATNSHGYTRKTFNYELWRQMLPDPDWSRYER